MMAAMVTDEMDVAQLYACMVDGNTVVCIVSDNSVPNAQSRVWIHRRIRQNDLSFSNDLDQLLRQRVPYDAECAVCGICGI